MGQHFSSSPRWYVSSERWHDLDIIIIGLTMIVKTEDNLWYQVAPIAKVCAHSRYQTTL